MSLGALKPDKALAAARSWVRATILVGLRRDYPSHTLAALYNDKALEQIRQLVLGIADAFAPPAPRGSYDEDEG